MKIKKPSIFVYTNYRLFLGDLYEHLKETTDYFSYRYFAKKAGFKSPNYLKLVIEGERNLSQSSTARFTEALKLNKSESDFFEKLVGFTQATNNSERAEFALKILQSKIYQKLNPLREEQLKYYSSWFQIGIRELALCKEFNSNPEWIAKQFRPELKVSEVKKALSSLIKMGMLKENPDGILKPCEQNITTNDEVISSFVALYHKQMMDKAKESIDLASAREREISSICVPVSAETFEKMKHRIQDFRKELIALATQDTHPDQVYQLNLQLFPLTNKLEKK